MPTVYQPEGSRPTCLSRRDRGTRQYLAKKFLSWRDYLSIWISSLVFLISGMCLGAGLTYYVMKQDVKPRAYYVHTDHIVN